LFLEDVDSVNKGASRALFAAAAYVPPCENFQAFGNAFQHVEQVSNNDKETEI